MTRRITSVRTSLTGVACLGMLIFLVPPAALTAQSEDEEALREAFAQLNEAFEAGDSETLASFYEENMVRVPPGQPVVLDVATLIEQVETFRTAMDYGLDEYQIRRVDVSGDLAYTLATYTEHWTPKAGGETTSSSGRWAIMWKRQEDGSWKIAAEIWNLAPEED